MHNSYEERLKHKADFRVKYNFFTKEEGGREMLPYQGIRSDFWFQNENHKSNEIYIIWPENENGDLILGNDISVKKEETARMWIMIPERRIYLKDKIGVGAKGYFKEGNRSTAECEVIEIIGLNENPTHSK